MMISWGNHEPPPYEPMRKRLFKKRLDKLRLLFNSVDETSLKKGDKTKLKILMAKEVDKLTINNATNN